MKANMKMFGIPKEMSSVGMILIVFHPTFNKTEDEAVQNNTKFHERDNKTNKQAELSFHFN